MTIDDVITAIVAIADNPDMLPNERKGKIIKALGFAIGEIDRSNHSQLIDYLATDKTGFTKTDAKEFIRGCVADAKLRNKEAQRHRAEQARVNLLSARIQKGKVSIDVGGRQLSDIAKQALRELSRANGTNPTLFVRSRALVRVVQDEHGHWGIEEFTPSALLGKLGEIADWETVAIDVQGLPQTKAVFPPREVVHTILASPEWPGIPALSGVVTSPVLSRDAILHDKPGYNPATKLFYTGGVKLGDTTPTSANIERAKELILNNLLVDFPFRDEAGLAHAVSYLLLPFVRDMIDGPTPPYVIDSPTPGTGKGLQQNACAYPFLGHDVPTMAAARDDDEWRKRITTHLMGSSTHLVIDNVNHELDSGSLASAFTQPVWEDRTLGSNRLVQIPIRTIWAITANNIKMSEELARRCIWIRLDANVEKPWERTGFKHPNLMEWVRSHRNEIVTAAITLIRTWIDIGMPQYTRHTKGSYERWAGIMGGILEAVGIPGFLDNETELYDRVVSKNDLLVDFVKAWWEKQQLKTGDDPSLSSYELFRLASYAETDADATLGEWRNLLGEMLGDGKPRSRQTKLGRILNDYQDKIIAGYKIRLSKTANGMKYWHLESTIQVGSTIGSTNDLQVVEQLLVEPVEPNSPYPVRENKFFSTQKIVYQNGEEKNNNFYRELGETGSTGSTQKEESCGSICGSGLVEPGRTYGEVLPGSTEQRLPLPVAKWITGLGSYAEAQQAQKALSGQWQTASGKDGDGFFVKCPNWQTIVTTVSSKEG